jgi:hypothetical protein
MHPRILFYPFASAGAVGLALLGGCFGNSTPGAGPHEDAGLADTGAALVDTGAAADVVSQPDGSLDSGVAEAGPPAQAEVLASDAPQAYWLVTDGHDLYWTDWFYGDAGQQLGRVMAMSIDGGPETTLATINGPAGGIALAPDAGVIYFSGSNENIYQVGFDGGGLATLVGDNGPEYVASDGTDLYYIIWGPYSIAQLPPAGTTPTVLAPNAHPIVMTVGGGRVFWTSSGALLSAPTTPVDGGGVTVAVDPDAGDVSGTDWQYITSDGTSVYWTRQAVGSTSSAILSVPVGGGTPQVIFDAGTGYLNSLAADGVSVYFVMQNAGLYKVPVDGGPAVPLDTTHITGASPSDDQGPTIAVDSTSVYWINQPQIVKIAK